MLDVVPPDHQFPFFDRVFKQLEERHGLHFSRRLNGRVLRRHGVLHLAKDRLPALSDAQTRQWQDGELSRHACHAAGALED